MPVQGPAPPSPVTKTVDQLEVSFDTACARMTDGHVACWGASGDGVLGVGTPPSNVCTDSRCDAAVRVKDIDSATRIVMGMHFVCALTAGGEVQCWGDGSSGQLGEGRTELCSSKPFGETGATQTKACATTPVPIAGITGVTTLAASDQSVCAINPDGVWCWGDGTVIPGKVPACTLSGSPIKTCATKPTKIPGLANAVELAATGSGAFCARLSSGTVKCWGNGRSGELGDGIATAHETTKPVSVVGITDAAQLAGRAYGMCARRDGGEVMCWGDATRGQLGDGTNGPALVHGHVMGVPTPRVVRMDTGPLTNTDDLWARGEVTCAARESGTWCWGNVPRHPFAGEDEACPSAKPDAPSCATMFAMRTTDPGVRRTFDSMSHSCVLFAAGTVQCSSGVLHGGGTTVAMP